MDYNILKKGISIEYSHEDRGDLLKVFDYVMEGGTIPEITPKRNPTIEELVSQTSEETEIIDEKKNDCLCGNNKGKISKLEYPIGTRWEIKLVCSNPNCKEEASKFSN